jgi:hypothetical protein
MGNAPVTLGSPDFASRSDASTTSVPTEKFLSHSTFFSRALALPTNDQSPRLVTLGNFYFSFSFSDSLALTQILLSTPLSNPLFLAL